MRWLEAGRGLPLKAARIWACAAHHSVRRLGRYTAVAGGGSCSCMWVVLYSQCLGAVLYRRTSAGCVHSVGTETRALSFFVLRLGR